MVEKDKIWPWWPLFPLYPYGSKKTIIKELIPKQIWSLEQIQGIYYVAVPVRMTVININEGLMIINPLPPTLELVNLLNKLILEYGPIKAIVLPTASGLEHKIGLPPLARIFNQSEIWLCPGQWSFPLNLPLEYIGIPSKRTKILFEDGVPFNDLCEWTSLGPINLGLGRFQEISCYHKPSGSLHVTDAIVGIDSNPPEIFNYDPSPLLFHSRDRGDDLLVDSLEKRKKGWARLVLFSSYLRPSKLQIPSLMYVIKYSFRKGLRNRKSHFGIYPFLWDKDWNKSTAEIIGDNYPKIQIPPVLQRLIFPRAKELLSNWLSVVKNFEGMKYLISAHYSSPVNFDEQDCQKLIEEINSDGWNNVSEDNKFLYEFYEGLYKLGVIPKNINIKK